MLHKKRGDLLRKGIAAFLLLLMVGSSFAFAAEESEITESSPPPDSIREDDSGKTEQQSDIKTDGITSSDVKTVSATADENNDKTSEAVNVDVEPGNDDSEDIVQEIKEEEKVIIFAQGNEDVDRTVRLTYTKRINYEKGRTHDFRVICDGESLVAYCIEPKKGLGSKRTLTATPCNAGLLSKALYYSYGNPGYNTLSAGYLKGLNLKSSYKGELGHYMFCHVALSYIYDGESGKGDAFMGCSSNTRSNVRKFVAAIKSWPDPPAKSELGLSTTSFKAGWNEELGMQETPEISVTGTDGNSINLPVPENVTIVKGEEAVTTGSVKVTVGDSFKLRAPSSVQGQYTSPALATALTDFQPYIINLSKKQDQLFGINRSKTISYTIKWADFGRVDMIKTSSDPDITDGNTYYSLQDAEYGLYSKSTDKKYANLITDEAGKASAPNIPYGEYYLKELEPSRGYEIDMAKHDLKVASPAQSETVLEKPIIPDISTSASIAENGQSSATEGGTVNISDTVKYSGVEPGMSYTIVGRLMNKKTGQEVPGTNTKLEFTPDKSSGSLKMDYTVDSSGLGGNTVVAFEKLYQGSNLIASHEDINNKAQSVNFVKPKDRSPDTGDGFNLWWVAFALALSLIMGIAVLRLKTR